MSGRLCGCGQSADTTHACSLPPMPTVTVPPPRVLLVEYDAAKTLAKHWQSEARTVADLNVTLAADLAATRETLRAVEAERDAIKSMSAFWQSETNAWAAERDHLRVEVIRLRDKLWEISKLDAHKRNVCAVTATGKPACSEHCPVALARAALAAREDGGGHG